MADITRQTLSEIVELADEHRNEDHQRQREDDDEGDENADGRHHAAQTQAFKPVSHRIKEIGNRHAGDEGQQDRAEDIKEDDEEDEHYQPEENLTLETVAADMLWHRFPADHSPPPNAAPEPERPFST